MRLTLALMVFAALLPTHLTALPTIVLVSGAWHFPAHYSLLRSYLSKAGYPFVSQRNPSCNSASPNSTTAALDAAFRRDHVIMPLLDAGKEVVMVAHSYGGGPGAAAAKWLGVAERTKKGERGGVVGLVFISAILPREGQSLLNLLPGQVFDKWVVEEPNGQLGVSDPKNVFYNLVPNSPAQRAIGLIRPQSRVSLSTPNGPPAWADKAFDGRRAYWNSFKDQAIPSIAQHAFLNATRVTWDVESYPSDHSAFLSFPDELGGWINRVVKGWHRVKGNTATKHS